MKLVKTIKGYRPLAFVPDGLLLAKGYELFVADLECRQLNRVGRVPSSWGAGAACALRLPERVLRLGVRLACDIRENEYLLAERSRIWLLDLRSGRVQLDHAVGRGVRPLLISYIEGIDGFDEFACYGEYGDNATKEPVNIWVRNRSAVWSVAYTFPAGAIEHVHGVIPDKRRGVVWILTGDLGDSAGIWIARNNFANVSPILVGKQDFRCCWLAFWDDRILYATDSHFEKNSIRELVLRDQGFGSRIAPGSSRSQFFSETSGSSIYACMVQDELVFSTTVEPGLLTGRRLHDMFERRPGPGIKGTHSDLMIGGASRGFSLAGRWYKDWLPSRLCEFGSISFPTGTNPGNRLYAYFTALSGIDGTMGVFEPN